mmetsp:Transcript_24359/g.79501  ORF Transcript_24359/g.79501 Transcript_24359/m.79501 type:complete len:217 (+) Transcript_24359:2-652(+)
MACDDHATCTLFDDTLGLPSASNAAPAPTCNTTAASSPHVPRSARASSDTSIVYSDDMSVPKPLCGAKATAVEMSSPRSVLALTTTMSPAVKPVTSSWVSSPVLICVSSKRTLAVNDGEVTMNGEASVPSPLSTPGTDSTGVGCTKSGGGGEGGGLGGGGGPMSSEMSTVLCTFSTYPPISATTQSCSVAISVSVLSSVSVLASSEGGLGMKMRAE